MTKIENLANKLFELYNKAKTKGEYEEIRKIGKEMSGNLGGKSFDLILIALFPFFWAEYYLLLKFPSATVIVDTENLLCTVQHKFSLLKNPDNKVSMG